MKESNSQGKNGEQEMSGGKSWRKKEEFPQWTRDEQKTETGSMLLTKRREDTTGRSPSPSLSLLVQVCGHTHRAVTQP